jgi:hypothetical protein
MAPAATTVSMIPLKPIVPSKSDFSSNRPIARLASLPGNPMGTVGDLDTLFNFACDSSSVSFDKAGLVDSFPWTRLWRCGETFQPRLQLFQM